MANHSAELAGAFREVVEGEVREVVLEGDGEITGPGRTSRGDVHRHVLARGFADLLDDEAHHGPGALRGGVPHGVGEIWMSMVWEMYWELVARHGFDEDLYAGSGGNNLAIQLVIDGMKLQPCFPDFVEARDAILMADMVNNGGANECEIWRAFAKRGLGVNAVAGPAPGIPGVGDETEDFTIPATCSPKSNYMFFDRFESGDTSAWSSTMCSRSTPTATPAQGGSPASSAASRDSSAGRLLRPLCSRAAMSAAIRSRCSPASVSST